MSFIEKLIELAASKAVTSPPQPRDVVAAAEREVARDPERCFRFGGNGYTTLRVGSSSWDAGRFETPSLASLRERARANRSQGRTRLFALHGTSALCDIATLQALSDDATLFQVASQFNALESPGASIVPVAQYFSDPTQGPRASTSAFPGTLLRHYAAPRADGSRFTQTENGEQINLLAGIAPVTNGYLRSYDIKDPAAFAELLERNFDDIRVGVHDGVEVVGGDARIAQVFTSTLAAGGYSAGIDLRRDPWRTIAQQLLRAAYLGTFLAVASLGKRTVVLTLIGGGVFGNPHELVRDAIFWACAEADLAIDAVINLRENDPTPYRAEIEARGGTVIEV